MNTIKKIGIIDFVRGGCILLVWAVHLNAPGATIPHLNESLNQAWYFFCRNGSYGVTLFFVVSGFLITRLIEEKSRDLFHPDFKEFYIRRICRIFPLLFLVILAGLFLTTFEPATQALSFCVKNPNAHMQWPFWASILTFSFNWYKIANAARTTDWGLHWDVLWSLSIEEQFYLFYPLILSRLHNQKNLYRFLIFFILLGPISRWICFLINPKSFALGFENSFGAFDQIAIGALLYLVQKQARRALSRNQLTIICLWGLFLLITTYLGTNIGPNGLDRIYGPTLMAAGLFLFLLGGFQFEFFDRDEAKLLIAPGQFSYGGYLLHSSFLYLLWPFLSGLHTWPAFLIFSLDIIILSGISYHYYEKPANQIIYALLKKI